MIYLNANNFILQQYNKNLKNIESMQDIHKKHEKKSEFYNPDKLNRSDSFIFKFDDGKMGITPSERKKRRCFLLFFMYWYSLYA